MVRAPGKLMLLGEYGVLHGGPALVAAVDRYAVCTVEPADAPELASPGVFAEALLARHPRPGRYHLDSHALGVEHEGEWTKYGLGSSAATTVALTRAVLGEASAERVFEVARAVHTEVQGSGSGADVAACAHGGLLAYRAQPTEVERLPPFGRLLTVWTGQPASTPALVAAPEALRHREPEAHRGVMERLAHHAESGIDAVRATDRGALCRAAAGTANALLGLQKAAGIELFSERLLNLHAIAGDFCTVVKPTGAGGGDLAWCVAPDPDDEIALGETLQAEGWPVLWLSIDETGVVASRSC